jgi:L-ascorbate metabolism protein UlaG (beta-lactamase superfamily)
MVESSSRRVYFAGDTDVFPSMAELAPELDVALLPVWGWGPRLGPGHMDPGRAATALELLRPRVAMPIHWGTFWPLGLGRVRQARLVEPPHEFVTLARETTPSVRVRVALPASEAFEVP